MIVRPQLNQFQLYPHQILRLMEIRSTFAAMEALFLKHDINAEYPYFLEAFQSSLRSDGYELHRISQRYLRVNDGLEKPGDEDFPYTILLVVICLVCAGLASGLTQVIIIEQSHQPY